MEEAPNQRNAVASLTDDLLLDILRHLLACSLCCYKCVCCSWKRLISDNHKVLSQTVVGIYNTEKGNQNFTSVTDERPDLSFLPFLIDNVAVSDCCNGLILCWCLGAITGYRYVVCNPATQKFKALPPSIHKGCEVCSRFDPTASSYFHVIQCGGG
jgi:hypothetical protein